MRFGIELKLENQFINKDYNKTMLHIIKTALSKYDKDLYNKYYKDNKAKDFTFSCFLGQNISFLDNHIHIPDRRIHLNLTGYKESEMIKMFNAISRLHRRIVKIKNNKLKINNLTILKERGITEKETFNILSPILVREHRGDNKGTWYYTLKDNPEQFYINLNYQMKEMINEECRLKFNISRTKKIVSNLFDDIYVDGSIGEIEVEGPAKQIEYIYKAGLGSRKSYGYGMLK